eukprot:5014075-Pleurochrysis_carterae.AAC.1
MGSLAQKRYVARGVEQRVEDDVVKTLVAVEGDRGGANRREGSRMQRSTAYSTRRSRRERRQ